MAVAWGMAGQSWAPPGDLFPNPSPRFPLGMEEKKKKKTGPWVKVFPLEKKLHFQVRRGSEEVRLE